MRTARRKPSVATMRASPALISSRQPVRILRISSTETAKEVCRIMLRSVGWGMSTVLGAAIS